MYEIRRYTPEMADEWNLFVAGSKNGTFLFDRRYMDYHSDRFEDCSLMVYRKNRLFALLPGNRKDKTYVSHQGLTYGGLITDGQATAEHVCDIFVAVNAWLKDTYMRCLCDVRHVWLSVMSLLPLSLLIG